MVMSQAMQMIPDSEKDTLMMKSARLIRGRGRKIPAVFLESPTFSSFAKKVDLDSGLVLAEARTWDQGLSNRFSTTPVSNIFKGKKVVIFGLPGAFTGVCSQQHVPNFMKHADSLKEKGVQLIICCSVNDPFVLNAWAEKLGAKSKIQFYGDFTGKFHESLGLGLDLSKSLLGTRSQRYAAFVDNAHIKIMNVETARRLTSKCLMQKHYFRPWLNISYRKGWPSVILVQNVSWAMEEILCKRISEPPAVGPKNSQFVGNLTAEHIFSAQGKRLDGADVNFR